MKWFRNKALKGLGKHTIDNWNYISREHLQSLVDQGDDELISEFLNAEVLPIDTPEAAAEVQRAIMLESTRQEQDRLNK